MSIRNSQAVAGNDQAFYLLGGPSCVFLNLMRRVIFTPFVEAVASPCVLKKAQSLAFDKKTSCARPVAPPRRNRGTKKTGKKTKKAEHGRS